MDFIIGILALIFLCLYVASKNGHKTCPSCGKQLSWNATMCPSC